MNSKEQTQISRVKRMWRDEKGIALPLGLSLLTLLTLLGVTAARVTTTDIKIGGNYKTSIQAFYAAEASLEEARARLRGSSTDANYVGDEGATPSTLWSAYILASSSWQTSDDPEYDVSDQNYIPTTISHTNTTITANSLQSSISYWVKLRHKTEYDAEQAGHTTTTPHYYDGDGSTATHTASSPGNIVYYGYGNPATPTTLVQFTTAAATAYDPVEIARAYGSSGGSSRIVETEIVRNVGPPVTSALYAKAGGTVTGNSFVSGTDICGSASALPPVYTLDPATTTVGGSSTLAGTPSTTQTGSTSIDIDSYVNSLKTGATVITNDTASNISSWGSSSSYGTWYADVSSFSGSPLKLKNLTGYGILLVDGDLKVTANFTWYGLILVTGDFDYTANGDVNGAVLAGGTVFKAGNSDLLYDSCSVNSALSNQSLSLVRWKDAGLD